MQVGDTIKFALMRKDIDVIESDQFLRRGNFSHKNCAVTTILLRMGYTSPEVGFHNADADKDGERYFFHLDSAGAKVSNDFIKFVEDHSKRLKPVRFTGKLVRIEE